MRGIYKITFGLKVSLISLSLLAPSYAGTCASTSCKALIVELWVTSSAVRIKLDLPSVELAQLTNCTLVSGEYFTLATTHDLFEETYAALLAAQAAGQEVTLRPADGSTECAISYARVWSM